MPRSGKQMTMESPTKGSVSRDTPSQPLSGDTLYSSQSYSTRSPPQYDPNRARVSPYASQHPYGNHVSDYDGGYPDSTPKSAPEAPRSAPEAPLNNDRPGDEIQYRVDPPTTANLYTSSAISGRSPARTTRPARSESGSARTLQPGSANRSSSRNSTDSQATLVAMDDGHGKALPDTPIPTEAELKISNMSFEESINELEAQHILLKEKIPNGSLTQDDVLSVKQALKNVATKSKEGRALFKLVPADLYIKCRRDFNKSNAHAIDHVKIAKTRLNEAKAKQDGIVKAEIEYCFPQDDEDARRIKFEQFEAQGPLGGGNASSYFMTQIAGASRVKDAKTVLGTITERHEMIAELLELLQLIAELHETLSSEVESAQVKIKQIEDNVEVTKEKQEKGTEDIKEATEKKKKCRTKKWIALVVGLVILAIIGAVLAIKLRKQPAATSSTGATATANGSNTVLGSSSSSNGSGFVRTTGQGSPNNTGGLGKRRPFVA